MNSDKFFQKIRSIIREEIEIALQKSVIMENKNSYMTKNNESIKKVINNKNITNEKSFSSIQDILNETKKSLQESYDADDEFSFTSNMVDSFAYSRDNTIVPNGFSKEQVPTEVMNALNRDYSALMKKIDEKKR
jgi:hypothetical protein